MQDIAQVIPRNMRKRISVVPKPNLACSCEAELAAPTLFATADAELPEQNSFKDSALSYAPAVLELDASREKRLRIPDGLSMRIPGAIIVDPHVRKLADSTGMMASENAIWLLVVAVKEFTKSLLENTLSTVKSVDAGQVPPRLMMRPLVLSKKRSLSEKDESSKPMQIATHLTPTNCITSFDLHTVIANLPTSARSLSGCIARATYERSLYSTFDNSLVAGGHAIDELKNFIVSALAPPLGPTSQVQPLDALANISAEEALTGRKSPPTRGLGRGAKDLAALKARASSVTAKSNVDLPATDTKGYPGQSSNAIRLGTTSSSLTQSESAAWLRAENPSMPIPPNAVDAPFQKLEQPLAPSVATLKPPEQLFDVITASEQSPDAKSVTETFESTETTQGVHRGKGHGVKNLAAMRARSVTSSTDPSTTDAIAMAVASGADLEAERQPDSQLEASVTSEPSATPIGNAGNRAVQEL